ncbi:F-box/kelch-repeat protein At3g06240-like [Corylus avellana]|uniref:F-box/kelch-repeat protein At3g06240-like n=1 Tax=Corylus avellana TaxID=13451 RepID=UPI00286ADC1D|nr:F-box/kelch-repeat protein At3g06240-like [Corylus avellana]
MSSRELPEDLLTEILSKLPVKCLGRFKCVSKSWYALITNPNFITKHVTWANSHNPHRMAILSHWNACGNPRVSTLFNETLQLSGDVDLLQLFQHQVGEVVVVGACNGIICLSATLREDGKWISGYEHLVLWNPATRESKMLPPIHRPWDLPGYFSNFGFGFDSKTNDYKVVRILHDNSQSEVAVYSLSADSWRAIDSTPHPSYSINSSSFPSYLNGAFYWWAFDMGEISQPFLVSFDMSNEVFQKVLLLPLEASLFEGIAVVNDSVALILRCEGELDYSFDIWALNESCVERTWTKLLTIEPIPPYRWDLIQLREDGSVLLSDPNVGGFALYGPRTQQMRDLRINDSRSCSQLISYTESIVFLNGSGGCA